MKRILIVDDDATVARIYRMKLEKEGFAVEIAIDGESGLRCAETQTPDAVLLDLMLPKMPGLDVLRHMRANAACKNVPIFIFSNTSVREMLDELKTAGATQILSKISTPPSKIVEQLKQALGAPVSQNTSPQNEEDIRTETRKRLLEDGPAMLYALNAHLETHTKGAHPNALFEAQRISYNLANVARLAAFYNIANLSTALEALLTQIRIDPSRLTERMTHSISTSVGVMQQLFNPAHFFLGLELRPAKILVIDDDLIARRAATVSLQRANLFPVCIEHPREALKLAKESRFDVILLDLTMPDMDGFAVHAQLQHEAVQPRIIFYTTETRVQELLQRIPDADFLIKPYFGTDLALKALTQVLLSRIHSA